MSLTIRYIKEKRRLFLSWLFSYVIIIIISLLISTVAYVQSVRVIEAEINESHLAMLKQLQYTIDSKINDIEKIMTTIVLDKNIKAQCALVEPVQPEYRFSMVDVVRTIATCKIANSYINGIFIYIPGRDMIISDKGTSGAIEYFNIYYSGKISDKAAWMDFLKQRHMKEFHPMSSINAGKPDMDGILFLQSIPYDSHEENTATLGIVLDSVFLEKSLSNFNEIPEGKSIIVNSKNELVAVSEMNVNFNISELNLENKFGIKNFKIDDSNNKLAYIKSDAVDWNYINIIPKYVFAKKAMDIITMMLLCTLLCLIGGIVAAFVFARKNYNPVNNIMEIFNKIGKLKFDKKMNEFKMIENSMMNIIDENKSITQTLEQQKEILKTNFLNRLVKGYIKNSISLDDICSTYGIEFKSGGFVLIMFFLEELGRINSQDGKDTEEKTIELAQFVIANVMEELIKQRYDCVFFEVDHVITCIINIEKQKAESENIQNEIKRLIISGKELIMNKFGILFTASISNMHSSIIGISEAYKECLEAAEYKMVIGNNQIILYSEINIPSDSSFTNAYPLEVQQQFINCIRANNFADAKQLMENIFEQYFGNSNISLDMARCIMFAIINTMVNALNDINMISDNRFIESINPFQRLIKCETIYDIKKHILDILAKIEIYYNERQKESNSSKVKDIIAYIEMNYNKFDLSVSSIAEEFGLNPVYITRFFKGHTGEGILFTINRIRIEKAKNFLVDDNINIKDIAGMTGFVNSTVFIRTFKKYEGITPGKYRELNNIQH